MYLYIILAFILLFFSYGFYKANKNTRNVAINKININEEIKTSHYSNDIPLNVLHLSDIHLENLSITPEQLYNYVRNEKVDLVALTGDFLDRKRSIPKLIPYLKVLQKLSPTHGIYAVFGNHDYVLKGKNFKKLKDTLEQYGCKTLQNGSDKIIVDGQPINIIGIDDFSTKRSDLSTSFKDVTEGYRLVLTHDPNIVLHMKDYHFDYLLSGHFHGGQIHWPKPYHLIKMGKLVRLNMIKGLHHHDGKPFYISEGLGQTGVNIRIGSLPEITFHTLKIKAEAKTNKQHAM